MSGILHHDDSGGDGDDDGDDDDVSYGFRMTQDKLPGIILLMMMVVWMMMTMMESPIGENVLRILDMTAPKPRF